jgi:hypothetical protein
LKFTWLIAGIVLVGLILGRWVTREADSRSQRPGPPGAAPAAVHHPASLAADTSPLLSQPDSGRPNFRLNRGRRHDAGDYTTNGWEEKIEAILDSEEDDRAKGRKLLGLFSSLPVEGQAEAAQLLDDLLPDEDYPALARYLTNSATAEPVLDALVDGLVARPDALKLPLLLAIAQDQQHPKREDALDYLEGFLGQTYGTNWDEWSATVDQRLRPPAAAEDMTPQAQ